MATTEKRIAIVGEDKFSGTLKSITEQLRILNDVYSSFAAKTNEDLTRSLREYNKEIENVRKTLEQARGMTSRSPLSSGGGIGEGRGTAANVAAGISLTIQKEFELTRAVLVEIRELSKQGGKIAAAAPQAAAQTVASQTVLQEQATRQKDDFLRRADDRQKRSEDKTEEKKRDEAYYHRQTDRVVNPLDRVITRGAIGTGLGYMAGGGVGGFVGGLVGAGTGLAAEGVRTGGAMVSSAFKAIPVVGDAIAGIIGASKEGAANFINVAGSAFAGIAAKGSEDYLRAEQAYTRLNTLRPQGTGFGGVSAWRRDTYDSKLQAWETDRDKVQSDAERRARAIPSTMQNAGGGPGENIYMQRDVTQRALGGNYITPADAAAIGSSAASDYELTHPRPQPEDYGNRFARLGLNIGESYQYGRQYAQSAGTAYNAEQRSYQALVQERAFGLDQGTLSQFAGNTLQQANVSDQSIAVISEKVRLLTERSNEDLQGIVSQDYLRQIKGDTSLFVKNIELNNQIQQSQLQLGSSANATNALALQFAFRNVGGSFVNPTQAGQQIQGIAGAISNPSNEFADAFVKRTIQSVYSEHGRSASLADILDAQEANMHGEFGPEIAQRLLNMPGMTRENKRLAYRTFLPGNNIETRTAAANGDFRNLSGDFSRGLREASGIGEANVMGNERIAQGMGTGTQEYLQAQLSDTVATRIGSIFVEALKPVVESLSLGNLAEAGGKLVIAIKDLTGVLATGGSSPGVRGNTVTPPTSPWFMGPTK